MPMKYWDGVKGKQNLETKPGENISDAGYCAHGVVQFPTWHRPYLSMLEVSPQRKLMYCLTDAQQQSLYLRVVDIAGRYDEPHKSKYLKAAQNFRLPFWDYFRPRAGEVTFPGIIKNGMTSYPYDYSCPKVFTAPEIMIRQYPKNNLVKSPNPLSTFKFEKGTMTEDWNKLKLSVSLIAASP
jgi:tyrosinase